MTLTSQDKDLTLTTPHGIFNHRVGFLVFQQGRVLLQDAGAGYWFVTGGRVAFGESTAETVTREIAEELQTTADSTELAGLVENFFVIKGKPFHEVMVLYRANYTAALQVPKTDIHGKPFQTGWFTENELRNTSLKPDFLKEKLFSFQTGFQHVIHRDPGIAAPL
ncbi:MAG: NUDIX domain-containing protein [Micavibrio sp.]|nr:NUDIX domain-containing protein [Micavibrio sp.]